MSSGKGPPLKAAGAIATLYGYAGTRDDECEAPLADETLLVGVEGSDGPPLADELDDGEDEIGTELDRRPLLVLASAAVAAGGWIGRGAPSRSPLWSGESSGLPRSGGVTSGFEPDGRLGVGELRTAAMPARPAGERGEGGRDR